MKEYNSIINNSMTTIMTLMGLSIAVMVFVSFIQGNALMKLVQG